MIMASMMKAMMKMMLWSFALLILLSLHRHDASSFTVHALSTTSSSATSLPTMPLSSISSSQKAIIDGAEWLSIQLLLQQEGKIPLPNSLVTPASKNPRRPGGGPFTKYGAMTVVTGMNENKERVIGISSSSDSSSNNEVYVDSVAYVPKAVSDGDAIQTYISSIASVHCMLPRINEIGGTSNVDFTLTGNSGSKIVIVGGGELACYAAVALSTLGIQHVSLITTDGNPKVKKNKNGGAGTSKYPLNFRCLVVFWKFRL